MPAMITFWKGNRADAEYTREIPELAAEFWASPYGQSYLKNWDGRLELSLRLFLTDPHGFSSVWEDEEAFAALFNTVRSAWPREKGA